MHGSTKKPKTKFENILKWMIVKNTLYQNLWGINKAMTNGLNAIPKPTERKITGYSHLWTQKKKIVIKKNQWIKFSNLYKGWKPVSEIEIWFNIWKLYSM